MTKQYIFKGYSSFPMTPEIRDSHPIRISVISKNFEDAENKALAILKDVHAGRTGRNVYIDEVNDGTL